MPVKEISTQGRAAQGVRLKRLDEGDRVSAIAPIVARDEGTDA